MAPGMDTPSQMRRSSHKKMKKAPIQAVSHQTVFEPLPLYPNRPGFVNIGLSRPCRSGQSLWVRSPTTNAREVILHRSHVGGLGDMNYLPSIIIGGDRHEYSLSLDAQGFIDIIFPFNGN